MHRSSPYSTHHHHHQQQVAKSSRGGGQMRPSTSTSLNQTVSNELDLCGYGSHLCRREKLSGYEFCSRHILEDKNAPFKQCNFHYRSQRRCPRAAPKMDKKDGYCSEHARKALIARQKISGSATLTDLTQKSLQGLIQYKRDTVKNEPGDQQPGQGSSRSFGADFGTPKLADLRDLEKDINPFHVLSRPSVAPSSTCSSLPPRLTEDTDNDSDDDTQSVENAWRGDGDSDAESVDSEMENPLKHAGAYTSEEVIRIMRDKLIRLQKLYIDQFQRLRYLLREERRAYRIATKKEQEAEVIPIHNQARESLDEMVAHDEAKAMVHYNKPHGHEAVFFAELSEKRQRLSEFHPSGHQSLGQGSLGVGPSAGPSSVASPSSLAPVAKTKCSFNLTSSTKCGEVCVPLAKFCVKHILQDTNQVLFRTCGVRGAASRDDDHNDGDGPCETPIPDLFEWSSCVFHTNFLPQTASAEPASIKLEKTDAAVDSKVVIANGDLKNGQMNV